MTVPYRPTWLDPAQPGYINNKHGSNIAGDNLKVTYRFRSPAGSGASICAMRSTWSRIASAGGSGVTSTLWAQPSLGNPAASVLPNGIFPAGLGGADGIAGAVTAVYNGRIYIVGGQQGTTPQQSTNEVWSAPCDGPCIGSWRRENPLPAQQTTGGPLPLAGLSYAVGGVTSDGYLVVAGGQDQFPTVGAGYVFTCPILSDGTLGAWTQQAALPAGRVYAAGFIRNNIITVAGGSAASGPAAAVGTVYYATITAGVISSWTTSGSALTVAVFGGTAIHRPDTGIYLIAGGVNAANAVVGTVQQSTVTAGVPGAWGASANSLPAARCFATGGWVPFLASQTAGGAVVLGGNSNIGPNGTKTNTVWTNNSPNSAVWVASGTTLPNATDSGAVYAGDLIENESVLFHIGGFLGANVTKTIYYSRIASNGAVGAFGNGAGATMTTAQVNDIPYGGSVTTNSDGTVDVVFVYGGYDQPIPPTLVDGDLIQVTAQVWETSNGDPSVLFSTLVRIAQPPSITSAAAGAGGQPTLTWKYVAGAGGADEASWRVTIGALFDSGLRLDQLNQVVLSQAPMFPNAVLQTATITVKSKDTPMSGQSNSATSAPTFTPAYTAPPLPTGVTSTPVHALGKVTAAWTNLVNLLTANQSSLETGTTGWTAGGNTTIAQSAAQALFGTKSLSLTAVALGDIQAFTPTGVGGIPVTPSTQYTTLASFRAATTARNVQVDVFYYQASGAASAVRASDTQSGSADSSGGWQPVVATFITPSDAAFVAIQAHVVAAAAAEVHYVDGISFAPGAGTSWVLGGNSPAPTLNNIYYRRASLLVNSGFEIVSGQSAWVLGTVGTGVATIDSASPRSGANCLKETNPAAANYGTAFQPVGIPVSGLAGQKLEVGAYIKVGVAGATGPVRITFANPGTAISANGIAATQPSAQAGTTAFDLNPTLTTAYVYYSMSVTVPAGYAWAFIEIYANGNGTPTPLFVDDVYVGTPYYLLKTGITAVVGSAQSVDLMDELALGVGYDLAVTAVGPGPGESALVPAAATARLDPVAGGLSGMLHIAGNGAAYSAPLLMEQRPAIATKLDVVQLLPFAQQAPSVRNGVLYFRLVKVRVFLSSVAALRTLQALIAQDIAGGNLYYRDAFGTMLVCTFEPDQGVVYEPPSYRYADLALFEMPNQYAPSVSQGSATGYRAWANGSVVPLDTSEGGL